MRYRLILLAGMCLIITGCQSETPVPTGIPSVGVPILGKGTTTSATSIWNLPLDATGLGLVSDGRQSNGTFSSYEDGVCGVVGTIYTGGSGDATIQTNNPRTKSTVCQTARTMSLVYPVGDPAYPAGGTETMPVFLNLRNISNSTTVIPAGTRQLRILGMSPGGRNPRCERVRWSDEGDPGDKVWVERVDATTYHVYTKDRDPDPAAALANAGLNKAVCTTTGQAHNLSVDLHIVSKQPLP